ncbi:MAG: DUF2378 family protein [Myxococcaceae bacterium]
MRGSFERKISGRFVQRVFAQAEAPVADALLQAGLDVRSPGDEVPIEHFVGGLQLFSKRRFPALPAGEAMRRVGYELVSKQPGTLDERLSALPEKLETIGAFFEPRVHSHGERHFVAHFGDVASLHTFFLGLLEGVTSSTNEKVQVSWQPEGLSGARYDLRVA